MNDEEISELLRRAVAAAVRHPVAAAAAADAVAAWRLAQESPSPRGHAALLLTAGQRAVEAIVAAA
jgi:hypothetical protein